MFKDVLASLPLLMLASFLIAIALYSLSVHCMVFPGNFLCKDTKKEDVSTASYSFFVIAAVCASVLFVNAVVYPKPRF